LVYVNSSPYYKKVLQAAIDKYEGIEPKPVNGVDWQDVTNKLKQIDFSQVNQSIVPVSSIADLLKTSHNLYTAFKADPSVPEEWRDDLDSFNTDLHAHLDQNDPAVIKNLWNSLANISPDEAYQEFLGEAVSDALGDEPAAHASPQVGDYFVAPQAGTGGEDFHFEVTHAFPDNT